ncbi:MAG: hypothetical protein WA604_03315, partial [Candidatus Sulfotelmatobacter sp.]
MIEDVECLGAEDKFRSLPDQIGGLFQRKVEIGMPRAMERIPGIGSIEPKGTGASTDAGVTLKRT